MKVVFNIKAKNASNQTEVIVKFQTREAILTRFEVRACKEELENAIHQVLRDFGYNAKDIRIN